MNVSKEFKGKTIEDAVCAAAAALKIDRDDLFYEVIERPRSGFLGFGKSDATIKVTLEVPGEAPKTAAKVSPGSPMAPSQPAKSPAPKAEPMRQPTPRPQPKPQPAKPIPEKPLAPRPSDRPTPRPVVVGEPGALTSTKAQEFLSGVLNICDITANMASSVDAENNTIHIELTGENMGFVIGRRGETLDALQYLATIITNKAEDSRWRVMLDTENYREKRTQALISLAHKTAGNVLKTGKSTALEPMSPQERRIIHAALQENKAVTTFSTGSEPRRKIVVAPAGHKKAPKSIKAK